ncbi:MAG TPA: RDD family protein [Candidatus Sulfopaludibacter sp.]|nr:RDD family protein [Candidatus Sulfopaludibacter sp.]
MNWYYADQGQQTGPVTEEQFAELVRTGKIQPDTLVWREDMAAWAPYGETVAPDQTAATFTGSSSFTPGQGPEAVCAECGRMYAIHDMIRHGGIYICANCKPVFMQKLAEGAQINTGELNYARFGTRVAAYFLDILILMAVNMAIGMIAGLSLAQAAGLQPKGALVLQLVLFAIQMTIGILYEVILIGKYGATLGKMACKIKVVTADGGRVSYLRAFGRYFAKMLSSFTCLIGFIIAAFDGQRRALHDHICNTRVVFK